MESPEIRCFPASIGIWIYVMIRLQRQIGNSRSFTNKVWGKLAHAKSVTALPHEFVYSRDRELSRACTPSISPDTIKVALPGNSMGDLLLTQRIEDFLRTKDSISSCH